MSVIAIIPSLNPDEKLMLVVDGLLAEGFTDLVVVNDGSDAHHAAPFAQAATRPGVTVLTHEVNRGKGRAMKTAFAWCIQNRPDAEGVVTVDGDNQHKPADVRACVEAMRRDPNKVWLGVRDFSQEDVPLRSRLGNTITRSVVKLACGVALTDTQTGLRAIPAAQLPLMCRIEGERYEYETQMLMSLHDEGVGIAEVVIATVYIDENQTSHFNTLRDSWKIYRLIFRHMFRALFTFFRFSGSSLLCFLLDTGLFTLFNVGLFAALPNAARNFAATYSARVLSAAANYLLNRKLVFHAHGMLTRSALRYVMLAVVQAAVSAGSVFLAARWLGASQHGETLVKVVVDICLFLLSYQLQKRWVFPKKK